MLVRPLSVAFMLLTLCSVLLRGQSTTASLTGRITDSQRTVISQANVQVINRSTGIHYHGLTNEAGIYYVSDLPPGTYRIEVEKLGFIAVIESGIILHVQDAFEVNFEMELGSASESVTVESSAPSLETESSSLGTVVERREANELPLNGRNVFNLIALAPSVIPQGSATGTPVGVNPFGWGNYQVSGAFGNQSVEYLDGQPLNIAYINLPILIPTQDSIQEFKVHTGNLPAEWGRFAGGVTNLSTKGGTQFIRGEVYEYLRNRVFNANDFFLNQVGKPRPPWVQNQFGGEAGGPLHLHLCCENKHTFWFTSMEGFRLRTGSPITATVPTIAERTGDFSAQTKVIVDPCAGSALNAQGACPTSSLPPAPFQGNRIPSQRINPTSNALLKLWPLPNTAGTVAPSGTFNNFNTVASTGGNQNQAVGRIDQEITARQKLFARYSYWNVLDLPIDPLRTGLCEDRCLEHYATNALAMGYNYSISSMTIFDMNASVSYFSYLRSPTNAGFDLTTIGWPGSYNAVIPSAMRTPPTPCVANYSDSIMCSQGQSFIQDRDTQYNLSPSLTLVRGRNLYHLGFQFEVSYDDAAQTNVASGAFDFCGVGETCFSGEPMADFLLGYADNFSNVNNHFSSQAVVPAFSAGKQVYRALYINDTWRVTDAISLNLGLRYELQGPWSERFNRLSYFDPGAPSYLNQYLPARSNEIMGDVFLVSPAGRNNLPLDKENLAPRFGIASRLSPAMVLRTGYGIFWVPDYVSYALNPNNDMVNAASTTYTGTVDGIHPYNSISLPFPNGISPPPGRALGAMGTQKFLTQVVQSITEVDSKSHPHGYVQQWNLSLEQQLPLKISVLAAYAGSKGTHLSQYSQQINQISDSQLSTAAAEFAQGGKPAVTLLNPASNPFLINGEAYALGTPTTTVGQLMRPFPQYTSVELAGQGAYDSIFHSFQLTVQKRFSGGASLVAAYTKSKLISNADTLTAWLEDSVGTIQDNNNLRAERSLSSQDVPQRLVIRYVLDLPFGQNQRFLSHSTGVLNRIVGDWGMDGVTTFQKGYPLVFRSGQENDATLFGAGSRPNLIASCKKSPGVAGNTRLGGWFNTGCFAAPPDFAFGTEPRVDPTLRSDGIDNFDLAAFKRMMLGRQDRAGLELRVEFFNLLNRTQFAPPNTTCCASNNANFGVVTSTYPGTNPRLVQFATRFFF
jgi:hypothetical protein